MKKYICLLLMFYVPFASSKVQILDQIAAIVNSDFILQSELDTNLKPSKDAQFYSISTIQQFPQSKNQLLQFLINEKLIESFIKENQLAVSQDQIESQINQLQKKNQLTRMGLIQALQKEGIDFNQYQSNLKIQLQKRNFIDREIRPRINVSEDEIKTAYIMKFKEATSNIAYHLLWKKSSSKEELEQIVKDMPQSKYLFDELGTFQMQELNQAFTEEVKKMKVGSVSSLISLGNEWVLLFLKGTEFTNDVQFEKQKQALLMQLQTEQIQTVINKWLQDQKNLGYIKISANLP